MAALPFPWGCLHCIGRNERAASPSVPFHSFHPILPERASLKAARAQAYCSEIHRCIFFALCTDGKTGERTIIPERGQRKSWSPGATNRWITKCFTVPRTSLGIGKCDFCLRSSKLLLDKLRSSFWINPFPTHTLRAVWSIIMVWLLLWGHFNKLTLKVIWRFLWQKETYKVNCFFSSQTFVLHYHALNRHTSLLITWICMDLKLVYWRIKDSSSFIAFIHKGSFESPRFWKSSS